MARTPAHELPSYRLHKPKGLAVVRLNGRDIYLGKYGTPESRQAYERVIAEWLVNGRQPPAPPTGPAAPRSVSVNELILAYIRFAKQYYVKNGQPTGESHNVKDALKPVTLLYGDAMLTAFTPSALKAVRQAMIDSGLCRNVVNARVNRVRRMFKWGVENEFVPATVLHALQAVSPLKRGRTEAHETKPVQPVEDERIDAVVRVVSRHVAAMIQIQRYTGMRPNEVVNMRLCDIDRSKQTWVYVPASHKTEHHGRSRLIFLGPRAQAALQPFLHAEAYAFIFSPAEAVEEFRALMRANRKTPMTPSQAARHRKAEPECVPGDRYTPASYAYAVVRGCDRAFPPPKGVDAKARRQWRREHRWSPNQLRHTAATALRRDYGIEAARVVLGHTSPAVTMIYAAADENAAAEIMSEVG
jgi:integrase